MLLLLLMVVLMNMIIVWMIIVVMVVMVMTGDGGYVMMDVSGEDDIGCDGDDDFDGYVM